MSSATITAAAAKDTTRSAAVPKQRFSWAPYRTGLQAFVIVVWCALPFYWMIVTSFRDVNFTYDSTPWPTHITLDNYRAALSTNTGNHLLRAIKNSLIISTSVTIIGLVVGVFAAYAMSRLRFKFKGLVVGSILAASMFPGVAIVTPLFQLFTNLSWIDTYQALIIPSISFVLPLTVYTLNSFFREMPWGLEEAARIDGCTSAQAFRLIILPLAAPAIFTTAILAFIASWNEYLISSLLAGDRVQPVTVAIAGFTGSLPHTEPYTAVMAAATIITVPLIIMVLIFQRRIVAGLTAGGVKG